MLLEVTCKDELNDYERKLLKIATLGYGNLSAVAERLDLNKETVKDARDQKRSSSYGTLVTIRTYLNKHEEDLKEKSLAI